MHLKKIDNRKEENVFSTCILECRQFINKAMHDQSAFL